MNNIRQIQSLNKRELENAVLVRPAQNPQQLT